MQLMRVRACSNDEFREAVLRQEGDDVRRLGDRLQRSLDEGEARHCGVSRLRSFLEGVLRARYLDSVPHSTRSIALWCAPALHPPAASARSLQRFMHVRTCRAFLCHPQLLRSSASAGAHTHAMCACLCRCLPSSVRCVQDQQLRKVVEDSVDLNRSNLKVRRPTIQSALRPQGADSDLTVCLCAATAE
jgi:hypothetical protein